MFRIERKCCCIVKASDKRAYPNGRMCRRADLIARFWRFGTISRAKTRGHRQDAATLAGGVVYLFLGVVCAANAQSNTNLSSIANAATLSLAEAKRLAFVRNWDLLAAKSDVDIATAQRLVAHEFPNPVASFSVQKINIDNHSAGTSEGNGFWERNYDTFAAVNQLIEIGGKRRARKDSATAGLRSAEARLADARRTLDAGVTQAYVTVLLAEQKRQILTDSAASLRKEAGIAEARQHAGEISLADRSQIEIAAERLELDATSAAADSRNATIALETVLGVRQPQGTMHLTDSLEPLAEMRPGETNLQAALARRPDIRAAESARAKAEADVRLQKAMRIPDPTFLGQYEHEPPDQPNTLGFGVSFPLPLWNRNRGNITAAQVAVEQAGVQLAKVEAQAAAEIVSSQTTYSASLSRWQRYRQRLAPKSRQIRDTVAFAYEKGGASLLDLLSAQRNDNDVRLATAQAAADTANAAAALRAARNEP
jgi:outer membrane protein, heavy metal efflux system